ncbi:MAG TPA: hypothetical protein VGO61_21870 [Steroidobacteraceae bacterium]|jgi:hypothetical protein|nr:hypothetical protein [Steroidobacteraceae bacterium]
MIVVGYFIGIGWLYWWVLERDGTWREAAAWFLAPILPACAVASVLGRFPWIFFIPIAHMTAVVFIPIYWALRRYHGVRLGFPIFVGGVSGVATALRLNDWRIPGKEFWPFLALGLVSGLLFWVIAFFQAQSAAADD